MYWWISAGVGVVVLSAVIAVVIVRAVQRRRNYHLHQKVMTHFRPTSSESLKIMSRKYPVRLRVDLHSTLEQFLEKETSVDWFSGVRGNGHMETYDFASVFQGTIEWTSAQYDDVERCCRRKVLAKTFRCR
jgi:hypothetical protein